LRLQLVKPGLTRGRDTRSASKGYFMNHSPVVAARMLTALTVLVFLVGCSSTSLVGSWRDPRFQGPPIRKVLVIGINEDRNARRIFEDEFARQLAARGVEAVASYTLIPQDGQVPEAVVAAAVRESGAEGILMTRVVTSTTETAVMPGRTQTTVSPALGRGSPTGFHPTFYGHYSSVWTTYTPPTVTQFTVWTLETDLWSVSREQPIWSGVTRSTEGSNINRDIGDLVEVIANALAGEKLI
jgi:hypothetical protein